MRSIIAMWPSLPANCRLTSTRYWVSPSRRAAVICSTPSAAPGCSVKNVSGSSMTCTATSVVARTVAVAVLSRIQDISPKTAPGWAIRAKGVPSRSTVTVPETRTSSRRGGEPSVMRTSPAATLLQRQVCAQLEHLGHAPIMARESEPRRRVGGRWSGMVSREVEVVDARRLPSRVSRDPRGVGPGRPRGADHARARSGSRACSCSRRPSPRCWRGSSPSTCSTARHPFYAPMAALLVVDRTMVRSLVGERPTRGRRRPRA